VFKSSIPTEKESAKDGLTGKDGKNSVVEWDPKATARHGIVEYIGPLSR
jgi:hypothetical protein